MLAESDIEQDPRYQAAKAFALSCSGEPLSREATIARLRELAKWGVDLSLVEASLDRTPTERLQTNAGIVRFANAARVIKP